MKRILFVVMILFFTSIALQSEEDMKYITGKITLAYGGNVTPEVYIYYNRFQNSDDNLIKVVQADANGEFKIGFSNEINYANIHLTAPGYASYITKFIEGDKNPRIEATLSSRAIPTKPDSISVFMLLKNGRSKESFAIDDKNEIRIEIDFADEKYKALTVAGEDTITYTYYIDGNTITPTEDNYNWRYDNNGDYFAVAITKNDKFKLKIDLDKYSRSDDPTHNNLTIGGWVNSAVNEEYNRILELLPTKEITNLYPEYLNFVRQKYKENIKELTPEALEERKQATVAKFNRLIKTNDSLLAITKSPYLKDYLNLTKLSLLNAIDSANKWEDYKKMLQSMQEIPVGYHTIFNNVVSTDEFIGNPKNYIDILEQCYDKSKDLKNRYANRFGLYTAIARSELVNNPVYRDYLIRNISELINYDNLDSWIKIKAPKTLTQIKMKSIEYAPDFSFKTLDGKERKLSEYRGKWVLLDFWGTWCSPCISETPFLVDVYNTLGGEKFEMISIASDRNVKVVSDYVKKNEMKWANTVALEGYAKGVLEQYGITSYPTLMLIDPDGKFVRMKAHELRGELLIPTIRAKLEKE